MDNSSCFNFTNSELTTNTAVSVVLHSVATVACLFAVSFIIYAKLYQSFAYRLILYLMTTASLYSLTLMFESAPVTFTEGRGVHVRAGWEGACEAVSYGSQMVESAKLTIIAWIVLYLVVMAVFNFQANQLRYELSGLFLTVLVPLIKDWLPFAWGMYGISGMWCWIKLTDNNCSDERTLGLALMFAIEYGPVLVVSVFTIVSFIIILISLRKNATKAELSWRGVSDSSTLKAGLPLIGFPLMYVVVFLFRISHRIYYVVMISNNKSPYNSLWLAHTIAIGLAAIIIPVAFICHPSTLRRMCTCLQNKDRRLTNIYRRDSLSVSKEHLGRSEESVESDPFLPRNRESMDSLVYKSVLSSIGTSIQNK